MRQSDVRRQFKTALRNAETALQDLSERLDDLPGTGRRKSSLQRAGRSLRRTAGSMAEHVPLDRASAIAADTSRTVREHPVKTLLTAAIAGYCVWSLVRFATEKASDSGMRAGNRGEGGEEGRDLEELQPGVEAPGETRSYPRH
jgi:hypothetical protein